MLEVFFCNVGDGDAVLVRERGEDGRDYAVLVDAGRPFVESRDGSLRKDALEYLLDRQVTHLDRMILTHPHIDHVGGAARIVRAIRVDRLQMLTVPPEDARFVPRSFISTKKPPNGLRQMLNILKELCEAAQERGTAVETIQAGEQALTDRLTMTVYYPRAEIVDRQKQVFDALYRGDAVEEGLCTQVAKERNLSSLMLRFAYGHRSVLITGDRYAADWEGEAIPPCDILKLPHHGDRKSMTPGLLNKLSPWCAVVSCENDPNARKERPSEEIMTMLLERLPLVLCTENRPMAALAESTTNGIRFDIQPDGAVTCRRE